MHLQMDPLYNPLRIRPIQTGRGMLIESCPDQQFRLMDDLDHQSGSGSVPTQTQTPSDIPEQLLTLVIR
jgi:hypothetical protein